MFGKIVRNIVPDCPRCGSKLTGRYELVYQNDIKKILRMEKLAKLKGERIRVIVDYKMPYANCFCDECDTEWHGVVKKQLVDKDDWYAEHDYTEEILDFEEELYNKKVSKGMRRLKKIAKGSAFLLFGIQFKEKPSKEELEMREKEARLFGEYNEEEEE